jgi:hypothetical protein
MSYGPNGQFGYDVVTEENQQVSNERKKHPSLVAGGVGAVVGAGAGAIIGSKRNPYMKNGVPTDKFAKLSYDRFVKSAPEDVKKSYGQYNEVFNRIDKVKTADELRTLMNNNPEASKVVSEPMHKTSSEFLSLVNDTNLASNKSVIKDSMKTAINSRHADMKNQIQDCWNAEQKKFIKPATMDDNVFNAIQKTTKRIKAGFIAKWAAISAAVLGVAAFITHKIIKHKKEAAQQT